MQLINNEKIIDILEKTLNHVDPRLIDHGKRVAYLMYRILKPQNRFDSKQLRDICILAMLHDVGAYKTEEIDKMVIFETINVWEHSIYGYLFLKYFSPLNELAPAILYHHAECDQITQIDPSHQFLAQLISLCDRADVFMHYKGSAKIFREHIEKYRDIKYSSAVTDMFIASGINIENAYNDIDSDEEFNQVFRYPPLTIDEVTKYIKMIIFSIDFRSSQTVVHTITTACIAGIIAALLGENENEIKKVKTGAMLHDIGKIGIPVHILESTERLSDADMEIMRQHVYITEKILEGNVEDDIKNMAIRHHEKLNGTGYPYKLEDRDIVLNDRIIAIADIISALCGKRSYKGSYSKEKIFEIVNSMEGLLDKEIVALAFAHFDEIAEAIDRKSLPIIEAYESINKEYAQIMKEMEPIIKKKA